MTNPFDQHQIPFGQLNLVRRSVVADVFTGVDPAGALVTVVVLTAAGAGHPAVRAAFAQAVNASGVYPGTMGRAPVSAADLNTAQPWAASYQVPGLIGVEGFLAELPVPGGLTTLDLVVPQSGPPMNMTAPPISGQPSAWNPPPADRQPLENEEGFFARQPVGVLIAMVVCAVLVVVGGTAGIMAVINSGGGNGQDVANSPAATVTSATPNPTTGVSRTAASATSSTSVAPAVSGSVEPTLRTVTSRVLFGPTWSGGDSTYTMSFPGWPFSWRIAASWGCMQGGINSMPDAVFWGCIDQSNATNGQLIHIMIRACADACSAATRATMNAQWFSQASQAKAASDGRTSYVEIPNNDKGYYSVEMCTYVSDKPGTSAPLKYQIGLFAQSPSATKDVVLKSMNDVYSQVQ